jgi:hypothetical protein
MSEVIVAAAIKHPDGEIYALPAPARHCHIIQMMLEDKGRNGEHGINTQDQGFLTSYGRYIDREEAAKIADHAGQLKIKYCGAPTILFSEDIW